HWVIKPTQAKIIQLTTDDSIDMVLQQQVAENEINEFTLMDFDFHKVLNSKRQPFDMTLNLRLWRVLNWDGKNWITSPGPRDARYLAKATIGGNSIFLVIPDLIENLIGKPDMEAVL